MEDTADYITGIKGLVKVEPRIALTWMKDDSDVILKHDGKYVVSLHVRDGRSPLKDDWVKRILFDHEQFHRDCFATANFGKIDKVWMDNERSIGSYKWDCFQGDVDINWIFK